MGRRSTDWWPVAVLGSVAGLGAAVVSAAVLVSRAWSSEQETEQERLRQEGRSERTSGILGVIGQLLGTVAKVVL